MEGLVNRGMLADELGKAESTPNLASAPLKIVIKFRGSSCPGPSNGLVPSVPSGVRNVTDNWPNGIPNIGSNHFSMRIRSEIIPAAIRCTPS